MTEPVSPARFWAYVAAYGALWGAVEVTLGAFLHTLRVPGTGVALATLGAALLVAQRQILPVRGAALATGLVVAMCKSVSPGGQILGPMLGITVEALLVEIALLAAPRARWSAGLACTAAAAWALSQGLVMQVVVYGQNIVNVYVSAMQRAIAAGLPAGLGWGLLVAIGLLLGLAGGVAGALGRAVGVRAAARLTAGGTS